VVTQAQWVAVMSSNPSKIKGDNLPINNVSWDDAKEFISKLNALTSKLYRLPTEAEWEFAARGGNKSQGYKYSGSNTIERVGWANVARMHPVGRKQPNELGIYDMSGNITEWCSDWYSESYYSDSPQNNPNGPSIGFRRVLRGGSWEGRVRNSRVSNRQHRTPDDRNIYTGFRLAQP
jgi:formylglycine-generating enzyme required for sulfatase activity